MAPDRDPSTADREMVVSRVIDAPRTLVFDAFADPKHLSAWWGPNGFTTTTSRMEFRQGGVWRFVMHGPDGRDWQNKITYQQIIRPSLIAYSHQGDDHEPVLFNTTISLEEVDGKTRVTLRAVFPSAEERDRIVREANAIEGGQQTLQRLALHVATQPSSAEEFLLTRTFTSPREKVFQAWTDPVALAAWFGPPGMKVEVAAHDLRPGGVLHYCMKAPDGFFMWGKFVYREIQRPEKLSFVVSFSDAHQGITRHPLSATWPLEVLSTITLLQNGATTLMAMRAVAINASEIERKTFVDGFGSMQQGWAPGLGQLADYLSRS